MVVGGEEEDISELPLTTYILWMMEIGRRAAAAALEEEDRRESRMGR